MTDRSHSRQTILTLVVLAILLLVAAAMTLYVQYRHSATQFEESVGFQALTPPSNAPYRSLTGEPITLLATEPQVTVVYSWATWCAVCHEELVAFDAFASTLPDSVRVVAVNRKEGQQIANQFLATIPELKHIEIVLDPSDNLFRTVTGFAVPEIVVFDRTGEVVEQQRGTFDETTLRRTIQGVL